MSNLKSAANVANVSEIAKCCKVDGCKKLGAFDKRTNTYTFSRGYCTIHYDSLMTYGDVFHVENTKAEKLLKILNQKCKIEGCSVGTKIGKNGHPKPFTQGYCNVHYKALIRYGDPLHSEKFKASELKRLLEQCCKVPNCKSESKITQDYCVAHYKKFMKYGDPLFRVRITKGEDRINSPLWSIYRNMLNRCNSPKNAKYKDYGGRDIKVCSEWQGIDGFSVFCNDMGDRPSLKHTLERKNVNLGYCKDNCTWALICQQAVNKRNSNKTVGVSFNKNRNNWVACLSVNKLSVLKKQFKTEQAAQVARIFAEIKHFGVPIKHL